MLKPHRCESCMRFITEDQFAFDRGLCVRCWDKRFRHCPRCSRVVSLGNVWPGDVCHDCFSAESSTRSIFE